MEPTTHLETVIRPLFEALPLEKAMPDLLPQAGRTNLGSAEDAYENPYRRAYDTAAHLVRQLGEHPTLQAAIWLYVDDLDRSHTISQNLHSPEGAYWHGIMHRREGDFSNAKYWFRQAGKPLVQRNGFDPLEFVDKVAAAADNHDPNLLEIQRWEWSALFLRCAQGGA